MRKVRSNSIFYILYIIYINIDIYFGAEHSVSRTAALQRATIKNSRKKKHGITREPQ
jgi:hypothetical protein